ncbi:MAG: sigma-70 family RNA polymerase sigma factor [Agriterribacter sp.]
MKRTNCQELLHIETISAAFKNNQQEIADQIISCFYSCYQSLFLQWAKITYQHYPTDIIEFAANNAFTDAVLKLKEAAVRGELYQSNASVKTVLLHYCRNMLLRYLKTETRLAEKNKKLEAHLSVNAAYGVETENEFREKQHQHIMQALEKMTPADRQIIQWKHIDEKSNDEIAALLAITVASATNRIYRCMQRLRELVENMDKQNH